MYLKDVWPDLLGVFLAGPEGPGKHSEVRGALPPQCGRLSRASGAGQTSKRHPNNYLQVSGTKVRLSDRNASVLNSTVREYTEAPVDRNAATETVPNNS